MQLNIYVQQSYLHYVMTAYIVLLTRGEMGNAQNGHRGSGGCAITTCAAVRAAVRPTQSNIYGAFRPLADDDVVRLKTAVWNRSQDTGKQIAGRLTAIAEMTIWSF